MGFANLNGIEYSSENLQHVAGFNAVISKTIRATSFLRLVITE